MHTHKKAGSIKEKTLTKFGKHSPSILQEIPRVVQGYQGGLHVGHDDDRCGPRQLALRGSVFTTAWPRSCVAPRGAPLTTGNCTQS